MAATNGLRRRGGVWIAGGFAEDHAEAASDTAEGRYDTVAARSAADAGVTDPGATAQDTVSARGRSFGVQACTVLVILIVVPVATPFAGIAVQVIQAPSVGLEAGHRGRGGVAVIPGAGVDRHVAITADPALGRCVSHVRVLLAAL